MTIGSNICATGVLCPKGSKVVVTSREMNECGFALFRSIVVVESAFPKVKLSKFLSSPRSFTEFVEVQSCISCWSTSRYRLLYPWMICLQKINFAENIIKIFGHLVAVDQSTVVWQVKSWHSIWLRSRLLRRSVLVFEPCMNSKELLAWSNTSQVLWKLLQS